jgi:hypothetical protein
MEEDLLDHLFLNEALPNIGDASGLQPSAAAGNLYISLHTADPGETGDQTTNEIAYTSYARVAVPRSGAGFSRTGSTISNAGAVTFPACTGGSGTATYFRVGTASSGAGYVVGTGLVTSPAAGLAISDGITPEFAIGTLVCTAD